MGAVVVVVVVVVAGAVADGVVVGGVEGAERVDGGAAAESPPKIGAAPRVAGSTMLAPVPRES